MESREGQRDSSACCPVCADTFNGILSECGYLCQPAFCQSRKALTGHGALISPALPTRGKTQKASFNPHTILTESSEALA